MWGQTHRRLLRPYERYHLNKRWEFLLTTLRFTVPVLAITLVTFPNSVTKYLTQVHLRKERLISAQSEGVAHCGVVTGTCGAGHIAFNVCTTQFTLHSKCVQHNSKVCLPFPFYLVWIPRQCVHSLMKCLFPSVKDRHSQGWVSWWF